VAGRRAKYKRILTGTPVANGPFDVYSQLKFLDEGYWKEKGFASYEAFRTYFGVWEQAITGTGQRFNRCVRYRNLEQLHSLVQGIASRVTKEEVLDLPPKLYTKRYHELSSAQEAAYVALRDQLMMELDSGELLTTELVVVRLLRLQQVLSGFLPTESGFPTWLVEPDDNPRLKILKEILDEAPAKVIVWARFRNDVDLITNALGEEAVRYDGSTSEEKRLEARERFQNDERTRYFVGNPAAAGEGLTLHAASTVVYYSNSFNLTHRLQSEDRAHRIGQRSPVTYVDLIAAKTVDEHIVRKLRHKLDLASKITGDEVRTWL
jgi:SNF2 family DNA or RNA helicase